MQILCVFTKNRFQIRARGPILRLGAGLTQAKTEGRTSMKTQPNTGGFLCIFLIFGVSQSCPDLGEMGPKSGPGGSKIDPGDSKIDPGGSEIDPGASPERPKTETSGQNVHRELPESVPGAFFEASSIFLVRKGLPKRVLKTRFFSKNRSKGRYGSGNCDFLQKCGSAANTAWRESKWLSGRSRINKNRSRRVKN